MHHKRSLLKRLAILTLSLTLVFSASGYASEGATEEEVPSEAAQTEEEKPEETRSPDNPEAVLTEVSEEEGSKDDAPAPDPVPADAPSEEEGEPAVPDPAPTEAAPSEEGAEPDGEKEEAAGTEGLPAEAAGEAVAGICAVSEPARVISGFYPLSEEEALKVFSDRPSLPEILSLLPSSLTVSFADGGESESIPVSWKVCGDDYDGSDDYYFQFDPVLDESLYSLSSAIGADSLPYVGVMVETTFSRSESGFSIMSASAQGSSNEVLVLRYLMSEMGLNQAASCGVLANIQAESGFRPTAVGDSGTSYGICQWHASRYTALKSFCSERGFDYTTLDGQLAYLNHELSGTYKNSVLAALKKVDNTAQGAYEAGYSFCYNFERPSDKENRSKTRGNSAKNNFYPKYKSYAAEPYVVTPPKAVTGGTLYLPVKANISLKSMVTEFTPKKWKSSASKIVSVSSKGKLTVKKASGETPVTITAMSAGKNPSTMTFTVYSEAPVVTGSKTIRTKEDFVLPERITGLSRVKPTGYASSKPTVLAVDESTGKVTVVGNGTAKLTTIFENRKLVTTYKVKLPYIKQSSLTVKAGKMKKLTLKNKHKSLTLTLKSDSETIATVDEKGRVYGNLPGNTEVKLYVNNAAAPIDSCRITVLP